MNWLKKSPYLVSRFGPHLAWFGSYIYIYIYDIYILYYIYAYIYIYGFIYIYTLHIYKTNFYSVSVDNLMWSMMGWKMSGQ